jgi:hypothetical protein
MWIENLGIHVENEGTDSAIFVNKFATQDFDIARMGGSSNTMILSTCSTFSSIKICSRILRAGKSRIHSPC